MLERIDRASYIDSAAIHEYFERTGISVFADYRYYPNQLVFNKILDALKKTK